MRLSDFLGGLGIAVPFYPSIARMLDSDSGAILLAQLWFLSPSRADDDGWMYVGRDEIEKTLGMARRRQESARKSLVTAGVLEERKAGMPRRTEYRVDFDRLETLWCEAAARHGGAKRTAMTVQNGPSILSIVKTKKESGAVGTLPGIAAAPATAAAVIGGALDGLPPKRLRDLGGDDLRPLLDLWADTWRKPRNRVLFSDVRRAAWRKAIDQGVKPSDFAKAILGMRHDDWPERRDRCDWPYVLRHLDRWTSLYDDNGAPTDDSPDRAGTKTVEGVRVPLDYEWDAGDKHMMTTGHRFDLKGRQWVK